MEAIDLKLIEAVKSLPESLKHQVLDYIQNLNKSAQDIPDKNTVSEDFEEYLSRDQFISKIQSLPHHLQAELWQYLEKLKVKAQKITEKENAKKEDKKKFVPKAGFGGGKGFFILKEGWDDPLTEEFKDYM